MVSECQKNIAALYEEHCDKAVFQQLANKLDIPLVNLAELNLNENLLFLLSYREGCLTLLEKEHIKNQGLTVEIDHRQGEQRSWPMAKQGALAQAIGRKTKTVVDATTGWGQDSLALFRMGYEVYCIERSPVMAELLVDGFRRLQALPWVQQLNLQPPQLQVGNAIDLLGTLAFLPDCIYLDPMFPPKQKKSALAKKSIMVLREMVGDDADKQQLFAVAWAKTGKRVVVKSPDYAEPLGGKPSSSFQGKLVRYDVYLK